MSTSVTGRPKQTATSSPEGKGIDLLSAYQALINAYVKVKIEQAQCYQASQTMQDKEKGNGAKDL
jgi:hypothetical protein